MTEVGKLDRFGTFASLAWISEKNLQQKIWQMFTYRGQDYTQPLHTESELQFLLLGNGS